MPALLRCRVDQRLKMQRAARSRPGIRYHEGDRSSIRYRLAGKRGPMIVFTPDPPFTIEHYDDLIERLQTHFRVCVFDVPGFGFSFPRRNMHFDFDTVTQEIESFLDALDSGPYILAFSCVAGYTAAALAIRRPSLVSHIVLIQTPGWEEELKWKRGRDKYRILQTPLIGQGLLQLFRRSRSRTWLEVAINDTETRAHCATIADDALRGGASFCLASVFQDYLAGDSPVTGIVEQPALIIWGSQDRSHRKTDLHTSFELAANARSVSIPKAGHFPEIEYSSLVADHLINFASNSQP